MSKNNNRTQTSTITFAKSNKRLPKGWTAIGDNEMREPKKTYAEKFRDSRDWHKLMLNAEKFNKALEEELKKRKAKKKEREDDISNAEKLVEKKYHKDKTKTAI